MSPLLPDTHDPQSDEHSWEEEVMRKEEEMRVIRRETTRGGEEEEGWCLLLVILCDSVVQSLETLVVLHLWVCLALCKQLHQAEATVTRCQHQGSPGTSVVHHSREGMHTHTKV